MEAIVESTSGRVLIVEDDPAIRESLSMYLSHRGFEVDSACGGQEGLKQVETSHFDVLISDVMMPGMNGIAFMEQARRVDPNLAVVLITGYADVKIAIEAMKRGAEEFILKPFQFDDVWRVVHEMIDRRAVPAAAPVEATPDETLERKVRELSHLYTITEGLSEVETDVDVFQFLVDVGAKIAVGDRALFFVGDPDDGHFYLRAISGTRLSESLNEPVVFNAELIAKILDAREPMILSDEDADIYCAATGSMGGVSHRERVLAAPLIVRGEVFGVLSIHKNMELAPFEPGEPHFAQILLRKAALHIENTALYESLYSNLINTLNSLVHAIEAKDPYTRLHSQRVTYYALGIAETMGMSDRELEALRFAAPLHDIGKIGISDSILQKNGRPTEEEFDRIREHPELGAKILEPLGLLPDEESIILHHHERWDGGGYPAGLAGEEIPILARVVTVADAYDAMTSDRIYRRARSHDRAIEELYNHSGKQFDPDIVEGFVRYCTKNGIS